MRNYADSIKFERVTPTIVLKEQASHFKNASIKHD